MPNIKSASKRVELSRAAAERNKAEKSRLKTIIKKFESAAEAGNADEAKTAFTAAIKAVDQAAAKGLLHKNTAARKKSSMALKFNKIA